MWEPAIAVALSIFLTCTLFLLVYGLSYLAIMKLIDGVRKIKAKLKEK